MGQHEDVEATQVTEGIRERLQSIVGEVESL